MILHNTLALLLKDVVYLLTVLIHTLADSNFGALRRSGLKMMQCGGKKTEGGNTSCSYFNEAIARSRCSFRSPNTSLEPENGSLHLHRKKWDLHY